MNAIALDRYLGVPGPVPVCPIAQKTGRLQRVARRSRPGERGRRESPPTEKEDAREGEDR
jgi:hypothetical protein